MKQWGEGGGVVVNILSQNFYLYLVKTSNYRLDMGTFYYQARSC